jgi:HSP20 family protein
MKTVAKSEKQQPRNGRVPAEDRKFLLPPVNIVETKDGYHLEAEMPGVNKSGLEVLLEGNELTLVGRRERRTNEAELIYRESRAFDYRRVFALDPTVETSRIEAKMEHGVLKLFLPKAEKVRPRKIEIAG